MKKLVESKGITVLALVITVIIMLILAGITISAISGADGLFSRIKEIIKKYNNAIIQENAKVQIWRNIIDEYMLGIAEETSDITNPLVSTLVASNVLETGFKLTATGEDETGIAKYEFYINGSLEKTVNTTEKTVVYDVTGKTGNTTYTCKVKVYDNAGNSVESTEVSVKTGILIASKVKVGDFVDYDAGTWSAEDFRKITNSSGSPTVNQTKDLPTKEGQFGGFILNQSRNTNSTPFKASYTADYSGWRVWEKDDTTGAVTLISAGHPETYYYTGGNNASSINILKNRDYTMYKNNYAEEVKVLTGPEAVRWYNKHYDTNYAIVENGKEASTMYNKTFSKVEPISVLDNGAYYWLVSGYSLSGIFFVRADARVVSYGGHSAQGVRLLITLKSNVLLDSDTGDGSVDNPWKLAVN